MNMSKPKLGSRITWLHRIWCILGRGGRWPVVDMADRIKAWQGPSFKYRTIGRIWTIHKWWPGNRSCNCLPSDTRRCVPDCYNSEKRFALYFFARPTWAQKCDWRAQKCDILDRCYVILGLVAAKLTTHGAAKGFIWGTSILYYTLLFEMGIWHASFYLSVDWNWYAGAQTFLGDIRFRVRDLTCLCRSKKLGQLERGHETIKLYGFLIR